MKEHRCEKCKALLFKITPRGIEIKCHRGRCGVIQVLTWEELQSIKAKIGK